MKLLPIVMLLSLVFMSMPITGCIAHSYEPYEQLTVASKFQTGHSIFTYEYYVVGTDRTVHRANKDVYTMVFENYTYVFENGYVEQSMFGDRQIGYTSVKTKLGGVF